MFESRARPAVERDVSCLSRTVSVPLAGLKNFWASHTAHAVYDRHDAVVEQRTSGAGGIAVATALIIIDAQKIYTDRRSELYSKDANDTIKKINALIGAFQKNRQPIFFIRHIHKLDGSDLGRMFDFTGEAEEFNFKDGSPEVEYDDKLKRPPAAQEIAKNRYSAFVGTDLDKRLKHAGIDTV